MPASTNERSTAGPASGTACGQHEEDAGADGGADAEHRQLEGADGALEILGGAVRDRRPDDGPAPQHLLGQAYRRWGDVMVPPEGMAANCE